MRIGVIGFSKYFRKVYWPYLIAQKSAEISAVCDIMPEEEIRKMFIERNINEIPPFFNNHRSLVLSARADAVMVSTPHALHFEHAKICLQNGLHVFLDKPLACHFDEAKILVELAGKNNLHIAVGNQRRFESPYLMAKSLIHHRDFGDIYFINYLFANSPWEDYSKIWRGNPTLSGGGALMDIGYLALDTLLWLLDKPVQEVFALAPENSSLMVETTGALIVRFKDGVVANITISYDAPASSVQEELAIYGSKKSLFIRRFQPQKSPAPPVLIELSGNGKVEKHTFDTLPDNSNPFNNFLNGIKNGITSESDGESHLQTVQVIEASYKSIQTRKIIPIST